ncbi:cellulase family glycosylhydrolase [Priestia sp. YIM B13486]|uniref:cellulase family glycosylhydrolase n=1 Tax=Priestia sp. YIM B13486 TaxID=3366304 RepID=UPI003672A601
MEKYKYLNKKSLTLMVIILIIVSIFTLGIMKVKEVSLQAQKKNLFSDVVPKGLGVNIHFTGNPIDIDLIKDAGFKIVRQDILWENVEKERGVYNFKSSGYDELNTALIQNDIRPYFILDYSNKLYEKNQSIVTKKGQDAFVKYVKEVTTRYKGEGVIWEIWNEPNSGFWEPKPNIKEYSSLVKRVSKTIKDNDSTGIVVAPALSKVNSESLVWLEGIFKEGTLDYIDAVSVHPYRPENPETVLSDYQKLKSLISKYKKGDVPILAGEWGYSTAEKWKNFNVTEQQQAEYLVRMFLINLLSDVPVSVWYDWKNDGDDPLNSEHNFGIREQDVNIPKQSYIAINTLTYNLSNFKLNRRINVGNQNDYILEFTNGKEKKVIVYWTSKEKHNINLTIKSKKNKIVTMYGKEVSKINGDNDLNLEISNEPTYIISE